MPTRSPDIVVNEMGWVNLFASCWLGTCLLVCGLCSRRTHSTLAEVDERYALGQGNERWANHFKTQFSFYRIPRKKVKVTSITADYKLPAVMPDLYTY